MTLPQFEKHSRRIRSARPRRGGIPAALPRHEARFPSNPDMPLLLTRRHPPAIICPFLGHGGRNAAAPWWTTPSRRRLLLHILNLDDLLRSLVLISFALAFGGDDFPDFLEGLAGD
jgi:hypothetical protein